MSSKIWIWIIVVGAILIALFYIPRISDPTRAMVKKWNQQAIDCLPQGHVNLGQHFHPDLEIYVDGKKEVIPANIGIVRTCMAEVHTHEPTGKIHLESVLSGKEFLLPDFFKVYEGKTLEREGFDLAVEVDGELVENYKNLRLEDKQQIILTYTKKIN